MISDRLLLVGENRKYLKRERQEHISSPRKINLTKLSDQKYRKNIIKDIADREIKKKYLIYIIIFDRMNNSF